MQIKTVHLIKTNYTEPTQEKNSLGDVPFQHNTNKTTVMQNLLKLVISQGFTWMKEENMAPDNNNS